MTTVSLNTQAKLLARYLNERGLAKVSHSEALEAIAHAQNFKSFNEAQAAERRTPKSSSTKPSRSKALELLAQAKEQGLTMADVRGFFAKFRTPAEMAFVKDARFGHREGELELDDDAEVSLAEPGMETGGAYVQMWQWIPVSEVECPENLLDALEMPWGMLKVHVNDDDFEIQFSKLEFNKEAIAQLRSGTKLREDTWLVKPKKKDALALTITVKHYEVLKYAEGACWVGEIEGKEWLIDMDTH